MVRIARIARLLCHQLIVRLAHARAASRLQRRMFGVLATDQPLDMSEPRLLADELDTFILMAAIRLTRQG